MVLQDKISTFLNKAQNKVASLMLATASDLFESYASEENSKLAIELIDVITCLQDELLDWSDYDIESTIDYYTSKANLNDIAIVNFEDNSTYIVGGNGSTGADSSWVAPFTELSLRVDSNNSNLLNEIARLEQEIADLDFSNLIPQEVLDEIADNTSARHTHSNKTVLDSVNQGHLDSITLNNAHRSNSAIHVTSGQKTAWDNKVSQTQLTDGLATKANTSHIHAIADVTGLSAALADIVPEKGEKGDDGITPTILGGTITEGDYSVSIDNSDPRYPVLSLAIPAPRDGEDFHIDVFGLSQNRLSSIYNNSEVGYAYLGTDNGMLYFRKPYDSEGNFISAVTTSGWDSVQFGGFNGWSPGYRLVVRDTGEIVLAISGWFGGSGPVPTLGLDYVMYLGPNGYTPYIEQAINIRGLQGEDGEPGTAGKIMFPDISDTIANRYLYDSYPTDTIFLDNAAGIIYRKKSDATGDWSDGYQWKGDKGEKGDIVGIATLSYMTFPAIEAPEHSTGRLYYDSVEDALTYYNSVAGMSNQIGRELWVRVKNTTGTTIPEGKVVYISGSVDNIATVQLASNRLYSTSRIIGITTTTIVSGGGVGYVTFFGSINGLNTDSYTLGDILYLSNNAGDMSNVPPTGGGFKVRVGIVTKKGISDGRIDVNCNSNEYTVETISERGFPDKSQVNLSFDDVTRILTVTPAVTDYRFYQNGEKYIVDIQKTLEIPDVEGRYYIYFDGTTLNYIQNFTETQLEGIIRSYPLVAYLYWDATNKTAIFKGSELHWSKGYGVENHIIDHLTKGAVYREGFGIGDITSIGNGSLNTHAQFSVAAGVINDEDIKHTIPGILSTNGVTKIYWRNSSGYPRVSVNYGFSVLTTGTGRLAYNSASGLTECGDNTYVWYHVFASGTLTPSDGLCTFVGRSAYASTTAAYADLSKEILNIQTSGLPSQEFKAIASVLLQTRNTYTNAVKARIVPATTNGASFYDWRFSNLVGGAGTTGGGGGITIPSFTDDQFEVIDNTDSTKKLKFEISGVTGNTTRTLTIPNKSGTVALLDDISDGGGHIIQQDAISLEQRSKLNFTGSIEISDDEANDTTIIHVPVEGTIGGYANSLSLTNTNSGVSGYKKFLYDNTEAETAVVTTVTQSDGDKLIAKYLYDSVVGITSYPSGVWGFTFRGKVNSVSGSTKLGVTYFRYTDVGTEVDLFTVWGKDINTISDSWIKIATTNPAFSVASTDRMGVKVLVKTDSISSIGVSYLVGGVYGSYLSTPNRVRHERFRGLDQVGAHPANSIALSTPLLGQTNQDGLNVQFEAVKANKVTAPVVNRLLKSTETGDLAMTNYTEDQLLNTADIDVSSPSWLESEERLITVKKVNGQADLSGASELMDLLLPTVVLETLESSDANWTNETKTVTGNNSTYALGRTGQFGWLSDRTFVQCIAATYEVSGSATFNRNRAVDTLSIEDTQDLAVINLLEPSRTGGTDDDGWNLTTQTKVITTVSCKVGTYWVGGTNGSGNWFTCFAQSGTSYYWKRLGTPDSVQRPITTVSHPTLTSRLLAHDFVASIYTVQVGDEISYQDQTFWDTATRAYFIKVTTTQWEKIK